MSVLLIDLDDTLYDERLYVESGFSAVAAELASRSGRDAAEIQKAMTNELDRSGRGHVFDYTLAELGLAAGADEITSLVALYRSHKPQVALYPGVAETLLRLRKRHRLAIVTDGLESMQRAKVSALGLESLVDTLVYCWKERAPKPEPRAFAQAIERLGGELRDAIVIGDSPHADMAAAAALGIPSIRVRSGRFASVANLPHAPPTAEIATFAETELALERLAAKEIANARIA
jgi:putative hydrolase of the HAD superfamily